jgi:hypothetical protein
MLWHGAWWQIVFKSVLCNAEAKVGYIDALYH